MKVMVLALVSFLLLSVLLVFSLTPEPLDAAHPIVVQLDNLRVHNLNTSKGYTTIQEAINAPETLDGHKISVASGTYYEHVTVNKGLSLIGEERSTTIIDGNGAGTAVYATANNVEIRSFTIRNGTFGLWLHNSQNSKIVGNTLENGSYGIRLLHSANAWVVDNVVHKYSSFGVELDSSGYATLRNNILDENRYNFGVDGTSFSDFINDIDASNTVKGKPIRYLVNQHDVMIDSLFPEFGYLALINSTNVKVQDLNVQDNIQGVLLAFTANSTVSNVNAEKNWNGIYITHSMNISASGNNANYNFDYGIKFFNSSRSTVRRNNVDSNGFAGIGLFWSPNSIVAGNEANLHTYNLHLVFTNNSVITENDASQSKPGGYSIAIYYSHNNQIYHNSLSNSLLPYETRNLKPFIPRNNWDNGLEGNFWSDYSGVDKDQNGLGDTPYVVGQNNTDNHPLMGKFSEFAVAFRGKTYNITVISNSTISQFQFNPEARSLSFVAAGFNGTMGFSRISVPNRLFQDLLGGDLTFLINGEQPILKRKWTDERNNYWYFSYANNVPESTMSPWPFVVAVSILLITSALVFVISKKKRGLGLNKLAKKGEYDG